MNTHRPHLTYQGKRAHYLGRSTERGKVEIIAAGHRRTVDPADVTITAPEPEPAPPTVTFEKAVDIWLDGHASGIRSTLHTGGMPECLAAAVSARLIGAIEADPLAMEEIRTVIGQQIDGESTPMPVTRVSLNGWAGQ